ncbi:MAG: serine/threonine-protein kinase, partial [Kofleriaceae bacterium]
MTLARRIKLRGAMPEGEAAGLLRGVCSALAAAHDKGIIHRDLKPDNLFLVADLDVAGGERIKLLDFGIAKLTDIGSAHAATKTGAVMGTPTYMSPEQCRGSGDVDLRADIYSLGCIFYQLLTGKPPFAMEGAGEVIGMHLYVQPEPPTRQALGISADSEALVMAMLSKDPGGRPQSARELGGALSQLAHAHGWNSSSGTAWNPDGSANFRPSFTPAYNVPAQPTPIRASTASPSQPTTLSGAASQSVAAPPKTKKGPIIAIGAALLLVAAGVTFSVVNGGDKPSDKPAAAVAPVAPPVAPVTPPPPTPPPAPPVVVEKVEPPPVVVAKPPEAKPVAKPPPIAKKKLDKKPIEKKPKEPDTGALPVETDI